MSAEQEHQQEQQLLVLVVGCEGGHPSGPSGVRTLVTPDSALARSTDALRFRVVNVLPAPSEQPPQTEAEQTARADRIRHNVLAELTGTGEVPAKPLAGNGCLVLCADGAEALCEALLCTVREVLPSLFVAVWTQHATECAPARLRWFDLGANQVTHSASALEQVLLALDRQCMEQGPLTCGLCGLEGLSEQAVFHHYPLYHINHDTHGQRCPICHQVCNVQVHVRNHHIPPSLPNIQQEDHDPEAGFNFALVVCRHPKTNKCVSVCE